MHKTSCLILSVVFGLSLVFTISCAEASTAPFSPPTVLVGCTPGESAIKSLFSINSDKQIDFVRWHLVLDNGGRASKAFMLDVQFGEGQPNTNGFKGGGEKLSFTGTYAVSRTRNSDVLKLVSDKLNGPILLVRLSRNNFHLLNSDETLMNGNGGWSYTLNGKEPAVDRDTPLASWSASKQDETASEVIFVGRTPCAEIAGEYKWTLERECPKLKWKLTLYRDPQTHQPTEYALQRTLERPNTLKGKWTMIDGTKAGLGAMVLRLDPDISDKTMSFLVGDENVLFFLDRQERLYAGNGDFSYTLNRSTK